MLSWNFHDNPGKIGSLASDIMKGVVTKFDELAKIQSNSNAQIQKLY